MTKEIVSILINRFFASLYSFFPIKLPIFGNSYLINVVIKNPGLKSKGIIKDDNNPYSQVIDVASCPFFINIPIKIIGSKKYVKDPTSLAVVKGREKEIIS